MAVIRARAARGTTERTTVRQDPDVLAGYLEDAAHHPGGHAAGVCFPETEADVAAVVRAAARVLPIGAQSSLTGGATPFGETLLSTARMQRILEWTPGGVRVEPGVTLAALDEALRARGHYYPPVPTYDGATVGGIVATNAAGAATFKYGSTRDWVEALTVVLADGNVLDLRRGETTVGADGAFTIVDPAGTRTTVPLPAYRTPELAKISAGYFVRSGMDVVDLFVGSEGTLGVVTAVELRLLPSRPGWLVGLVPTADESAALALVAALRDAARTTWQTGDPDGIDVAAVEYMDGRCLELLREDGDPARLGVPLPDDARAAILFQMELPADATRDTVARDLASWSAPDAAGAAVRLARLLHDHGVLDATIPALPGDDARRDALFALREAVPAAVNRRIAERQRHLPALAKSASDVLVPFPRLADALAAYRAIFDRHGIDHAIWGHVSDGNVHPNALPRTPDEMRAAREAQLAIGEAAIAHGGCPMAEHGVGRHAVKKRLLARFYGDDAVADIRRLKTALDPAGKLAPGVLFDP